MFGGTSSCALHEQSRTKLFLPYLNTLPGKNYASSKIGVLSLGPIGHTLLCKGELYEQKKEEKESFHLYRVRVK